MATQAQIEANRLNAQKSTGPRSAEGKDSSRFNALKHGITAQSLVIPGEDPAQLASLTQSYFDDLQPVGPVESRLVEIVALAHWTRDRFTRIEASYITAQSDPALPPADAVVILFSDPKHAANLRHLFRRQQTASREWNQALKDLRRLQQLRQPQPEPEEEEIVLRVREILPAYHPAPPLEIRETNPISANPTPLRDDRATRL